jgi:site-specific DNA recombinase
MKAYLIARVSTLDQSDALPGQIYRLKSYAEHKAFDYELFEILESAYKSERVSFASVIGKISNNEGACAIVFDKIDRYTRNSNEVARLNALCRAGLLELHFVSDSLKITQKSSAQEHFMLNMGASTAQYYSDAISDNVKRRNEQKWRDGEWCEKAPIGYRNTVNPGGKKWIEPDTITSTIVRETFELYASGTTSLREIAKRWREEYGLSTVGASRIDQVLKNPFYYGEMRVKNKLYTHKYDPIISRALFEQAKSIREGYKKNPQKWGGLPFPYRGLISCAECGCSITFETKKKKYTYGHCTRKKNKHPMRYINQDEITRQVQDILKRVQIPHEAYIQVSDILRKSHEEKKHTCHKEMSALDAEIAKYQLRKERVYEDYLDGKIGEELYNKVFTGFDTKLKLKQETRESLELSDDQYYLSASHLLKLAKDLPELFEKAEIQKKRTLMKIIVSNLELDGDLLRWKYKKPFNMMALCNKSSNWLPRLGSNQRPNR